MPTRITGVRLHRDPRPTGPIAACLCALLLLAAGALARQSHPSPVPGQPAGSESVPSGARESSTPARLNAGPFKVRSVEGLRLTDAARGKDLQLLVRAPVPTDETQTFPLVLFSHGLGGDERAFADLSAHWASHGYIVIHAVHEDSIRLRREAGEDLRGIGRDRRKLLEKFDAKGRVLDMKLILDSLDAVEKDAGLLNQGGTGRIDRERIAAAGHSAGAMTSMLLAGTKVRGISIGEGVGLKSIGDQRIRAAVVISGQGTTNRMFTDESWRDVGVPMLVLAGSKDYSPISSESPESRRHPFEKASPGDKHLLWIEGASHSSYGGKGVGTLLDGEHAPDQATIDNVVAATTLATTAFLDRNMKQQENAAADLTDQAAKAVSNGAATLTSK